MVRNVHVHCIACISAYLFKDKRRDVAEVIGTVGIFKVFSKEERAEFFALTGKLKITVKV